MSVPNQAADTEVEVTGASATIASQPPTLPQSVSRESDHQVASDTTLAHSQPDVQQLPTDVLIPSENVVDDALTGDASAQDVVPPGQVIDVASSESDVSGAIPATLSLSGDGDESGLSPDVSTGNNGSPASDAAAEASGCGSQTDHTADALESKPVDVEATQSVVVPADTDHVTPVSDAAASAGQTEQDPGGASAEEADPKAPLQCVYYVKWIPFKGGLVPIITQNENGPCPLLAIMNVLLLQGKIKLPSVEMVTSGQLMEYLADCIFENAPKDISEAAQLNYEQNMHDAMAVFHKLQTGLDVNVRFGSVSDFEYTPECIVFDLLEIPLYHGWLVDPEDPGQVAAVANCSYNQLVEKVITQKNSKREELVTEALIAEEFLNTAASQLTYHGLSELATTLKEEELCVFFRNNHFNTLYRHKNELFLLVTDQGFLTENNVVWETLSNVEGDGHFVDADFHTYRKAEASPRPVPAPAVPVGSTQQIDQDYLVALSLLEEQQQVSEQESTPQNWPQPGLATLTDHELAMRLQEEEDRRVAAAMQQKPPQAAQSQPPKRPPQPTAQQCESKDKKKAECRIL